MFFFVRSRNCIIPEHYYFLNIIMPYMDLKLKFKYSFLQQMWCFFLSLRSHTFINVNFVESHFWSLSLLMHILNYLSCRARIIQFISRLLYSTQSSPGVLLEFLSLSFSSVSLEDFFQITCIFNIYWHVTWRHNLK